MSQKTKLWSDSNQTEGKKKVPMVLIVTSYQKTNLFLFANRTPTDECRLSEYICLPVPVISVRPVHMTQNCTHSIQVISSDQTHVRSTICFGYAPSLLLEEINSSITILILSCIALSVPLYQFYTLEYSLSLLLLFIDRDQ